MYMNMNDIIYFGFKIINFHGFSETSSFVSNGSNSMNYCQASLVEFGNLLQKQNLPIFALEDLARKM